MSSGYLKMPPLHLWKINTIYASFLSNINIFFMTGRAVLTEPRGIYNHIEKNFIETKNNKWKMEKPVKPF